VPPGPLRAEPDRIGAARQRLGEDIERGQGVAEGGALSSKSDTVKTV